MLLLIIASIAPGLFAGAAIYINAVEHPARVSCETELAIQEFALNYPRRTSLDRAAGPVVGRFGGTWIAALRIDFGADFRRDIQGIQLGIEPAIERKVEYRSQNCDREHARDRRDRIVDWAE